ncbi:MAG: hypothetical protein AABX04_02075 [Nanoarchaeota archaeon]
MYPPTDPKPGQASKTIVITILVIVLILALVWFFWGKQLVGKAFFTGEANTAGFSPVRTFNTSEDIILTIGANIGTAQTLGAEFTLDLPEGVDCDLSKINIEPLMNGIKDLILAENSSCKGNHLFFRYFALNFSDSEFRTGSFDIARITIKGGITKSGNYFFNFSSFEIVNYADYTNLVKTIVPITVKVVAAEVSSEINITIQSNGIAVTEVQAKEYTINTKITPKTLLPADHLVLVTINVNGEQKAQFLHSMPPLAANTSEEVSFTYTFSKNTSVVIKAMVWKNLLTETTAWESLIKAVEEEYTVE